MAPVVLPEKSIFNLLANAVQPLFSAFGSFLISIDLRFQLRNPIFRRAQLMRELLRRLHDVSAVFFRNTSRSVEQLQDRLSRLVELIGIVKYVPRKWNDVRFVGVTANLPASLCPPSCPLTRYRLSSALIVACCAF